MRIAAQRSRRTYLYLAAMPSQFNPRLLWILLSTIFLFSQFPRINIFDVYVEYTRRVENLHLLLKQNLDKTKNIFVISTHFRIL